MKIVPSGARRMMVAQGLMRDEGLGSLDPDVGLQEGQSIPDQPEQETVQEEAMAEDHSSSPDLTEYISSVLQQFGYPPRRLEAFEKEFVNEKIFSGGVKDVTVTLPDLYYGTRKRLSDKDVAKITTDIQEKFGLTFVDAERKDKQLVINLTSQPPEKEDEFAGDVLDEVYGTPAADKKSKNKSKRAETIDELVKEGRTSLFDLFITRKEEFRSQLPLTEVET